MSRTSLQISELSQNRNFQFWALQALGWTGWVTLFAIRDAYWGQPVDRILLLIVDAIAGLVLTTLLRYLYRAVWDRPLVQRVIIVLVASYVMAAIWQPIKNYSQYFYYQEFELVEQYGAMVYFAGILGYSYFLMLGWSGLYFALKFYRMLQKETERSIRAESMAHEAQLRMLRYQLNPHFLFNTLNAISTLILEKNTEDANSMVSKLSHFLRYSLDKDPMQTVDLEHEINTMQLYLEIEQVRFDERLQIEIDVDADTRKALVPSLILQPLVENSIKYAVANREDGGTIRIESRKLDNELQLLVTDDGPGIDSDDGRLPEFSGVGLANTRERLAQLYGEHHLCHFGTAEPHGLKIDIRIPFEVES
ncbi:MAG: histidine kinase [Gammaproteobacteria bacterium]